MTYMIEQESLGRFFLNCTKNTELTSAVFARTVGFALLRNRQLFAAGAGAGQDYG
jgi:hypothetical protein